MNLEKLKEVLLPSGPILAVTLVGLLLLSGVTYYRAVEIQRFLEPALAISQPRNEVAEDFNQLLNREFGGKSIEGIQFVMGSIFVDETLLFTDDHHIGNLGHAILRKLGRVFFTALKEKYTGSYVDLILVSVPYSVSSHPGMNSRRRLRMQHEAELILGTMFSQEPALEKDYGHYFVSAALSMAPADKKINLVEFRIIPGEQLHIDVLTRLKKYVK